ncbi:hypothetical protein EDB83DRAFT_2520713 [Lactarius deliciosus]|nr:hypothetical protein EDB83DRAFT_2520713 [Lactarius deliciosus]
MRVLWSLTLPAFTAELLATAPGTLTQLVLPQFVGVPPCTHDVLPIAVFGHGLVAALTPGRPLRRVTLRIASTLYNCARRTCLARLRSSDLYSPDVDVRTRGRALENTGAGLEVLELWRAPQMRYTSAARLGSGFD